MRISKRLEPTSWSHLFFRTLNTRFTKNDILPFLYDFARYINYILHQVNIFQMRDFKDNRKGQTSNWSYRQSDTTRCIPKNNNEKNIWILEFIKKCNFSRCNFFHDYFWGCPITWWCQIVDISSLKFDPAGYLWNPPMQLFFLEENLFEQNQGWK